MKNKLVNIQEIYSSNPLVSIMIPTYNRPELFEKTLQSALAQSYEHIEILVNDNSTNEDTSFLIRKLHIHDIFLRSVLKIRSRRIGLTPTFSCQAELKRAWLCSFGLSKRLCPVPTFSRHGRAQASLALLIWLIEKVLQDIGIQNVSGRGCVAGYTTDET